MKKHFLVFVLGLFTAWHVYGQSLVIAKSMSDTLVQGDTQGTNEIPAYFSAINVSSQPVDVLMRVDPPAGSELVDSFSVDFGGMCCLLMVTIIPEALKFELLPGDSLPHFLQAVKVHPNRDGIARKERMKVTLFNADDTTDKVVHYINYEVIKNLDGEEFRSPSFSVYPNPTNGDIRLEGVSEDYRSVQVDVFDLSGRFVRKLELDPNTDLNIDLSSLAPGPYQLSISHNQQKLGSSTLYIR